MKRAILFAAVLIVAGALQSQLSDRLSIFGAAPDFLIAATIGMGLALDPALGAAFGLAAGLVQASIVGLSFGGFIISRSLLGFVMGSLRMWVFQDNPIVLGAAALVGTVICESIYFLIDPSRAPAATLSQLPMESVYNSVLAMVCYGLVKRGLEQRKDAAGN